jgi:hypothetical protein
MSSRAWQCPSCFQLVTEWEVSEPSHDYWAGPFAQWKRCSGVPVEVVVTPLTETRKGWTIDHSLKPDAIRAEIDWQNLDPEGYYTVPVLVVPVPEEAGDA